MSELLITGGSGTLGSALYIHAMDARYPTRNELDITNLQSIDHYWSRYKGTIKTIVHCAAMTSPPKVEQNPIEAAKANIVGTMNLARLCYANKLRLVYISTDYVYPGTQGFYSEESPLKPSNKYAWSKLGGECAVRMLDNYLILRLSFGKRPFPYSQAYTDQFTSRLPVDEIAPLVLKAAISNETGVLNLGSSRKSVYEYAKHISPNWIGAGVKRPSYAPADTSLDISKYFALLKDGLI